MARKGDIVRILWRDIVTELSSEKPTGTIEAVAVGRIINQKGKDIELCSGWYVDEKEWPSKDRIAIPKGCIDKVEVLDVRS